MRARARIHLQVRLNNDHPNVWLHHTTYTYASSAVDAAKRLTGTKDRSGYDIFNGIRLRFDRIVIDKWSN